MVEEHIHQGQSRLGVILSREYQLDGCRVRGGTVTKWTKWQIRLPLPVFGVPWRGDSGVIKYAVRRVPKPQPRQQRVHHSSPTVHAAGHRCHHRPLTLSLCGGGGVGRGAVAALLCRLQGLASLPVPRRGQGLRVAAPSSAQLRLLILLQWRPHRRALTHSPVTTRVRPGAHARPTETRERRTPQPASHRATQPSGGRESQAHERGA